MNNVSITLPAGTTEHERRLVHDVVVSVLQGRDASWIAKFSSAITLEVDKLLTARDEQWRAAIAASPPSTAGLAEAAIAAVTATIPDLVNAIRSDTVAVVERDAQGRIAKVETTHL